MRCQRLDEQAGGSRQLHPAKRPLMVHGKQGGVPHDCMYVRSSRQESEQAGRQAGRQELSAGAAKK